MPKRTGALRNGGLVGMVGSVLVVQQGVQGWPGDLASFSVPRRLDMDSVEGPCHDSDFGQFAAAGVVAADVQHHLEGSRQLAVQCRAGQAAQRCQRLQAGRYFGW